MTEPKAEDRYRVAAILIFSALNNCLNETLEDLPHPEFQNIPFGSVSIATILEIHTAAILVVERRHGL
jgi:hypothetical protein